LNNDSSRVHNGALDLLVDRIQAPHNVFTENNIWPDLKTDNSQMSAVETG